MMALLSMMLMMVEKGMIEVKASVTRRQPAYISDIAGKISSLVSVLSAIAHPRVRSYQDTPAPLYSRMPYPLA